MARSSDWMPRARKLQIALAKNWLAILQTKAPIWNIPPEAVRKLTEKTAESEQQMDENVIAERTRAGTARSKAIFDDLESFMRDFKRRYYLIPPLKHEDLVALKLKSPGSSRPQEEKPRAQPEGDWYFPGIHLVELRNIRPAAGFSLGDVEDYRVRVHYGLTGAPTDKYRFRVEGVPASGYDLPYSIWASRKKIRLDFEGESGNRVYVCLQYENKKGKTGPFGPIFHAFIP